MIPKTTTVPYNSIKAGDKIYLPKWGENGFLGQSSPIYSVLRVDRGRIYLGEMSCLSPVNANEEEISVELVIE